jgi:NAD(P)H-flavin reductase/ferredoxin
VVAAVTVEPFGETLEIQPGESLLAGVLRQGRFLRYGCKHGGCGTCRARLIGGDCRLSEQTSYALSDADRADDVVLLCSTYPAENGNVVIDVTDTMDLTADEFAAGQVVGEYVGEVAAITPLAHDIRLLRLSLLDSPGMEFVAGQYAEVQVPGTEDEWRSFSMANSPSDPGSVDFVIKVIPGGRFSSTLDGRLRVGERLRLRGPLGQFGIRLSHRPMLMVAGGSGMAPILAMLAQLEAGAIQRPVTFLFGARCDRDLFHTAHLEDFAARHDWFEFIPALSEPERNAGPWHGECGLITEVLERRVEGSMRGYEAYLCGPPPMIDAAIKVLERRGCKPSHVHFDRFVPSG